MATIVFNSVMIAVISVMLVSQFDAYMTVLIQHLFNVDVWASAIILTLNTLRIGQGGLFFLGSQNKFTNNLSVDALAVVIYVLAAISLYSTAHVMFRATGGLHLFKGAVHAYDAHLQLVRMTTMYSQFFSYWTTAADLTVYGAFEPFLHLALSLAFLILILFNNALALEAMVTNCVNTLDSLSDNASRKAIVRVTTLLLALCSFILNNQLGFATVVTIENTVIPLATAVVVLLELLVVGALYGFERVYANVLSMSSHKEEDKLLRLIWGLFYYYSWKLSPILIGVSLILAFPKTDESMLRTAFGITVCILLPTPLFSIAKILQTIGKMRNVGTLLSPEYELWGPKMTDDRRKAAVMEKKLQIRTYW